MVRVDQTLMVFLFFVLALGLMGLTASSHADYPWMHYFEGAEVHYLKAIKLNSEFAAVWDTLGVALLGLQRGDRLVPHS